MRMLTIPLLNQSASQHAVVAKGSLTAAGLSDRQIQRLVQQGVIERVLDGAYRDNLTFIAGDGTAAMARVLSSLGELTAALMALTKALGGKND